MYCSKCGKELKEDEKICSECNTTIKTNTTEQVKNTLKNFWNKAKETYKNAMPKIPTLELEFNEDIEKILLDMGFEWFYSNKNGEKLRLYKYYTDGVTVDKVEIETFSNDLADIYIFHQNEITSYELIIIQMMYDFIRLRNYIYVKYSGSTERTKLVDYCELKDINDKKSKNTNKILRTVEVKLNKSICENLKSQGFVEKYTYENDGKIQIELKKDEIALNMYYMSKDEMEHSTDEDATLRIAGGNVFGIPSYNNKVIHYILEILKFRENISISDYGSAISLTEFLSNLDFVFELSERQIERFEDKVADDKYNTKQQIGVNTKRIKRT